MAFFLKKRLSQVEEKSGGFLVCRCEQELGLPCCCRRDTAHGLSWLGLDSQQIICYFYLGSYASELLMLWQKHLCSLWTCAFLLWMLVCFSHELDACFYSSRSKVSVIWALKPHPIFSYVILPCFEKCLSPCLHPLSAFCSFSPSWFIRMWAGRAG